MQTVNYEQRKQILAYACGRLNALGAAGAAVDLAAREYMERTATEDYSVAIRAVIKEAEIAARKDAREFEFRTRAYMSEWHLDKAEAERRVAAHDPRMAALYDETD